MIPTRVEPLKSSKQEPTNSARFWRWISEPPKKRESVDMVIIDKERDGTINPKVTDQHRDDTESRGDQRAKQ
jgi:hypothetical protein